MSGVRASQRPPLKDFIKKSFFIAFRGYASAGLLENRKHSQRPPLKDFIKKSFFIAFRGYASAGLLENRKHSFRFSTQSAHTLFVSFAFAQQQPKHQRPPLKRPHKRGLFYNLDYFSCVYLLYIRILPKISIVFY